MKNKLPKKYWKEGKSKFVHERARQEGTPFQGDRGDGGRRATLDKILEKSCQK